MIRTVLLLLASCALVLGGAVPLVAAGYQDGAGLIAGLAGDAGRRFQDFFAPGPVTVHPVVYLDNRGRKHLTALGAGLADELAGHIAGATETGGADPGVNPGDPPPTPQEIHGVLQEMGDVLRVQLTAVNRSGATRTYQATVALSTPIYRLLHQVYATAWPQPPGR